MKNSGMHPQEDQRLEALYNLNILDTIAETAFDELTLIASQICDTPVALITLVDKDRQWFKSKIGLSLQGSSRDLSICSHGILQKQLFEVADAQLDERFNDKPLIFDGPPVQYYAGYPFSAPNTELPLGMICVLDYKPRKLTASQSQALKALSNQVVLLLNNRLVHIQNKEINEKFNFYKTTFDHITDGVVLQDSTGKIIDFNNAALKMLDLTADQITGKTSMDPDWRATRDSGENFPGEEHPSMIVLKTGKIQKNVTMGVYSNKKEIRWISISSVPMFLNSKNTLPDYAVTTFTDIAESRNNLKNLQDAKASAESANLLKSEFLANMSHEVRTPLNAISGMTELALVSNLQEPLKEMLNVIKTSSDDLTVIINDILDFSKIEAGKLKIENFEFNLSSFIEETIQIVQFKIDEKNLNFNLNLSQDLPVWILSDPLRLRQILSNLLTNAVKFTKSGTINLSVSKIDHISQSTQLLFKVEDTGIGIEDSKQNQLFQSFFQADNSISRKYGGTGLGLVISKKLCEYLGGKIWFESEKNKGSIFYFQITCESVSNDQMSSAVNNLKSALNQQSQVSLNILLAEDVIVNQVMMKMVLKKLGHQVTLAQDGAKAVELFLTQKWDIVLMDIQMPELNGIEATQKIRLLETTTRTPIVALTANAMLDDASKCFAAGMDAYLTKPLNMEQLAKTLQKFSPLK